ncbi:MAG TPA: biotin carboxylase N-terminal domain-containing protein [Thermoanaerobaculia bacterium]|nr:biotin carboxylase N-terminal domain-containing protein [Thermoanaerobaculia bacterium]
MRIRRLLIANRGEIAVRIARTARERGIATIAVYSAADRGARHVSAADEAVEVGPAPAIESYLSIERILEAARRTATDAIHPGYGFLSENARFAEAVEGAGIVWVGPPPAAMRAMGSKIAARARMRNVGVPVVPGFEAPGADDAGLVRGASEVGFPVLVKASSGGGGKGMRRVDDPADLPAALAGARREAAAAFGDPTVYLEKAIDRPRHVEMQIFGDRAGRVVALAERECSIQRRHQKIVEEAPSPSIAPETRRRMAEAAAAAGRAVGYVGAGTVEFLVDREERFYFLEMNTRLQVEHPVTEETLGVDLVGAQIDVAEGASLPEDWGTRSPRGHAIECRVYAEDPESGLPRAGRILVHEEPSGPGVRVDSGIERGSVVGIDYDPILAKLIVHAADRAAAVARLRRALDEYVILGVTTNLALLRRIAASAAFENGDTDTAFLSRLDRRAPARPPDAAVAAAAYAAWNVAFAARNAAALSGAGTAGRAASAPGPWADGSGWRNR